MIRFKRRLFSLYTFLFLAAGLSLTSQTPNSNLTPGGANGMVFRFTKQVWLNPTVILAKQKFEQATNVKLLILPRTNASDTSNNTKIEKAFDKLLAFLVFKENIQGSIKFYFNPKNPSKPFSFDWSEDLQCKFNKFHNLYKDTIEGILNNGLVNHPSLNNFAALPFDSIIGKASRYCRNILLLHPAPCGENQNSEFDLAQINSTPAKLEFAKVNTTSLTYNGGYDILTYNELEAYYNTVTDLADGSTYKVGWKAIKDNDVLKLKLTKNQPSFDVSKLVFKNAKGTVSYNVSVNPDSTLSLSMGGQSPGSMAEVVAYYTPTTTPVKTYPIGAFNVKFYEPKIYNLVLVSLDDDPLSLADQSKLKDSLNKIYGPVFIQWNLSHVRYNLPTTVSKSIHDASSGLLSNYMPDMQPIVSSFKNNSSAYNGNADNTVYIILGASIDNTEIKGYMPRARNTGFVFVQPEVSSFFIRTLAHEVGHGAFNLKHIFSSDELGEGNKTQTNNLMDYASGRQLYKHQWDLIHDPSFVGWFEGDDEEGALLANQNYFTPAGLPFHATEDAVTSLYSADIENALKLNGILYGFTTEGIKYEAKIINNKFYGYYKDNGQTPYTDQTNFINGTKIKVKSMNYIGNCQVQFYEVNYTVNQTIDQTTYQNGVNILTSFNATSDKKIGVPVSIPDCQINYDAPLTSGVGKQMYDTYQVNINANDTAALKELKRIGHLINKLGPDLYNSFKAAKEWNNNPQSDLFAFFHYAISTPHWTKETLNATFLSIKKYSDAVQQLKLLTTNDNFTTTQIKDLVNQNFVCCNSFKFLFRAPFYQLGLSQRNNLLKVFLNDEWVTGRLNIGDDFKHEDIILNTITTVTQQNQHKPILDFLKDNGLIYKIVKNVDGTNYEALTTTLTKWILEEYPIPQVNLVSLLKNKQLLRFNDDYFGRQNTENILQNNKIVLVVKKWSGILEYAVVCDPYDYIEVTFQNDFTLGSGNGASTFLHGVPYKLPALYVYLLFNEDTKAKWMTSGKIAVNTALLLIGVGEINAAIKTGEWGLSSALAVADLGMGFSDIVINLAFKNEIQSRYPKFFETWQKISLCYGIGRIAQVGLAAAYKRCFVESQIIKNKGLYSQSTQNTASQIETRLQDPVNFGEFIDQPALASEFTFFSNVDNNYPTITGRIGQMDDETRLAFYNEFQNNPNNVLQNFESNPSQLDDWVKTRKVNGVGSLSSKLVSRGLSSTIADDIALKAMYIDDVIGANRMQSMIDELVSSSKFKNPEDLAENLKSVFSGNNVSASNAKNLLKEFEEGKYWMNQGDEVFISKKWTPNANEVDVTITTKNAIVECKNITGGNFKSVEDNLKLVVEKYTMESKLSSSIKNQYPNHYGKISISSTSNPFYNSTKADFISKIKNGDVANVQLSIIGNGSNQITLSDLKLIKELHIENANGRFIIKNTDW